MAAFATNLPGQPRMLDVIRAGLRRSEEMSLSVSFLRYSGLQLLVDDFRCFAERGGRARVLTSTYLGVTQPEALEALSEIDGVSARLHMAQSKGASNFHPKFVVFRGPSTECWVGSSNLSKGGLTTNVEANLCQTDPEVAQQVLNTFELLWGGEHTFSISPEVVDAYARVLLRSMAERTKSSLGFELEDNLGSEPKPNSAQSEALIALNNLRGHGERKAVVVAAPGVGKTYLAAFDAAAAGASSLLFVSNRLEHLTQAQQTFGRVFGKTRSTGLCHGGEKQVHADLVFSTVTSATNSDALMKRRFDYVVVDEFHHAAAKSYRTLLDSVSPDFLLGLTATPERQDGHDILELCDYNVAYEVRLVEAINREWLLPFHYFGIADETVDYSESFWRSRKFDTEKVENALMLEERVEHILMHAREKGYDGPRRATVGFCAGRRHARFMADALTDRGLRAAALTGEDDLELRQQVYAQLENPDHPLEWLFVADLLNEGVDIPGLNSLLFLRPTDSATIFIQQLGRGLRLTPECEVLTVLDFVGHHRNAWLTLDAISDTTAPVGPSTAADVEITPPKHCEVILDRKTVEILSKVQRFTRRKKDRCIEAYEQLREELGRPPYPVDLLARADVPDLGDFRSAFGSWLNLRRDMDDADSWELELEEGDPAYELLAAAERNWQQPRVYAYALLWGHCHDPETPELGYEAFFDRFPRWRVEHAPLGDNVWSSIEKKLGSLVASRKLVDDALTAVPTAELLSQVENRLRYTLETDFRTRHGGVLRTPDALEVHRSYSRPEIINHFGLQYDPARHNAGVIKFKPSEPFPKHVVLITKLDTSSAKSEFQYTNRFSSSGTFHWQSQNRMRQDNASGRLILDHESTGIQLHLFVQPRSHAAAVYVGAVSYQSVEGNGPMNVTFGLPRSLPTTLLETLNG